MLVIAHLLSNLCALLLHPDRDEVVYGCTELAAAAALQEQDLVVVGDVDERREGLFGVGEDLVGFGGAVRDFAESDALVLEVEEDLRCLFEDLGGEGCGL